jgi:hypothetical protein
MPLKYRLLAVAVADGVDLGVGLVVVVGLDAHLAGPVLLGVVAGLVALAVAGEGAGTWTLATECLEPCGVGRKERAHRKTRRQVEEVNEVHCY